MKRILCVAVGIVMDVPDDDSAAGVPLSTNPIDELSARLRREACFGRDASSADFIRPEVTAWVAAAFQECIN
jgi:hypothetical protein